MADLQEIEVCLF